jgi:hypothetical protein
MPEIPRPRGCPPATVPPLHHRSNFASRLPIPLQFLLDPTWNRPDGIHCARLVFAWQRHRNLAFRRPSMNCLALRVRVSSPRLNETPACTMPTVTSSSKPHRNSESMPVLRCSVRERCRARTPRVSTAKATTPGQAVGVPGYATRTCLSPAGFVTSASDDGMFQDYDVTASMSASLAVTEDVEA